jgi:hypothetical protein
VITVIPLIPRRRSMSLEGRRYRYGREQCTALSSQIQNLKAQYRIFQVSGSQSNLRR